MNYKIKLIVGFRRDQEHSVSAEEAHKAYYLFLNPEARSVFSNGLAIKGDQIQEIVPDYIGTMGWNPTYNLMNDDWSEIRDKGIDRKMNHYLSTAKEIAQIGDPTDLNQPLTELIEKKYPRLEMRDIERREDQVKSLKELLPPKA
jgi:hypothetical protein